MDNILLSRIEKLLEVYSLEEILELNEIEPSVVLTLLVEEGHLTIEDLVEPL